MSKIQEHAPALAVSALCTALNVPRATFYRRIKPRASKLRRSPPRKLGREERAEVLSTLNADRFCDLAPAQVYATLLDEERYICSERTM